MKPGYKQTEIGVIPDDWNPDYIENFAVITTGGKNTQDRVEDGHYPFYVRSQTVERINSYSFDGEAVLTAGDGVGTGKVFHYINGRFDVHQRVYRISNFAERVNGYFFYLYFSTNFYNRIMQMTAKSSVDSVRRDMISRMQVALPPTVTEQHAIATALSDVDALLAALEQLIAKKRDLKQAAMQQLLTGQTRLPGFTGKWDIKALRDCARFCSGTYLAQDAYRDGTFEVQGAGSPMGKHNVANFSEPISVIGRVGTVGRPRFMPFGCWVNNNAAAMVAIPGRATPPFVHLLLMTMDWSKATSVTAQPFLVIDSLMKMEFLIPPLPEQTAIATVLSDMDLELAALEQRRDKTRALKQGMMQELLTGRTRLV